MLKKNGILLKNEKVNFSFKYKWNLVVYDIKINSKMDLVDCLCKERSI